MRLTNIDYNQYKLKDICSIYIGLTHTPVYVESGVKFISSKNISNDVLDLKDINYISNEEFNIITNSAKPNKGDILFTRVGSNLGHPVIYELDEEICIFVSLGYIRVKEELVKNTYIKHWMNSQNFWNQVKRKTAGAAKINLNNGWMYDFDIKIPSLENQQLISDFISKLDYRISTQNKIIDKYESLENQIKDILLWKNAEGKKVKLSNIIFEISDKSTIQNQHAILSSTVKGLFLQSEYFDKEIASSNNIGYKVVHKGDVIISPQNLWMGNITYNDKFDNGLVSPSYKIFQINSNYNSIYISYLLRTYRALYLYKCVSEQGASVVRRNLNLEAFNELIFTIPSIEYQNKVADILDGLKRQVFNEKRYLNQLNKQKQFLLNNLFV